MEDGRLPVDQLSIAHDRLVAEYGWQSEVVYEQDGLASTVFTSPQAGQALWVLAGIHGEEPAGPNAIAQEIDLIGQLGQKLPIVLFPLCNPWGYVKDWRYPNERRDWQVGQSVAEAVVTENNNPIALALMKKIKGLLPDYPSILSIDHHEDEALPAGYIYSQGRLGVDDPVASRIIDILSGTGIPIQHEGITRFGEEVTQGVVGPVHDGSIDEFLAEQGTPSVIVIETPAISLSLPARIKAHTALINAYEELFTLVTTFPLA